MKIKKIIIILLVFSGAQLTAQENNIDSLSKSVNELRETLKEGFYKIDSNEREIKMKLDTVRERLDSLSKTIQKLKEKEKEESKIKEDTVQGWKFGGMTSLTASQVSLTNWVAGGQNSVSGAAFLKLQANYKKDDINWDNQLDLGYGLIQQGSEQVIKSDDKMELTSSFGKNISEHFLYSALFNAKSQFAPGYNYPNDSVKISDFLAPAYIQLSLGFEYNSNSGFSITLSPVTGKTTIVNDQQLADRGAFGVEGAVYDELGNKIKDGERVRNEVGGAAKVKIEFDLAENVSLSSNADLFSNYFNNPENIDINWETQVNMKINSFLSATFKTHLIYDHDIAVPVDRTGDGLKESTGPRTQFKQVAGLGFSYKF